VLSELRSPQGHAGVKAAAAEIPDADLYLSVLTVGEVAKGIGLLAAGRKKKALASWLTGLETTFADRIPGIEVETACVWGEITARARKARIIIPGVDGLLAATAIRHGLHVMTRTSRHFEATGALYIDPWQDP
jgi:predicted nucleic acid-binding protein